jgi:hypothetical protein
VIFPITKHPKSFMWESSILQINCRTLTTTYKMTESLGSVSYHTCFSNIQGVSKKSFIILKAYINLFRGHVQCFELS